MIDGDLSIQNCDFPWAFTEMDRTTQEEKNDCKVSLIKYFSQVLPSICQHFKNYDPEVVRKPGTKFSAWTFCFCLSDMKQHKLIALLLEDIFQAQLQHFL